jgi:hypothetical protein
MAGLGVPFRELFASYSDLRFRDARMAVAVLGLAINGPDRVSIGYLRIHFNESQSAGADVVGIPDALDALSRGIEAVSDVSAIDTEVASHIGNPLELTFNKLQRLLLLGAR